MNRLRSLPILVLTCLFLVAISAWAFLRGDDSPPALTGEQEALLSALSPSTAGECIEFLDECKSWKAVLDTYRKEAVSAEKVTIELADDSMAKDPAEDVTKLCLALTKRSPELLKLLGVSPDVQKRLERLQKTATNVTVETSESLDIGEDDLHQLLSDMAKSGGIRGQIEELTKIFSAAEKLRDPALLSRRFLDDLIARSAFDKPVSFGDVTLKITVQDPHSVTTSLFSADPGLNVSVSYMDGEYQITASGFYFRMVNGVPTPALDRLRWDPNQDLLALANRLGRQFANKIAGGLELPITVTRLDVADFTKASAKQRGALVLDVQFKLPAPLNSLAFEVKNVTITTRGEVILDSAGLSTENKKVEVPIGTTGAEFNGYKITLLPKAKTAQIESVITPAKGDRQAIGLDVIVTATLAGQPKLTLDGKLLVGGGTLGKITGEISSEKIVFDLNIPTPGGIPVGDLISGLIHLEMDRTGIHGEGDMRLVGSLKNHVKFVLNYDGRGSFGCEQEFALTPLVRAAGTLDATFQLDLLKPTGFRSFDASLNLTTEVDLGLYQPTASVLVAVAAHPDPIIHVEAHAMGVVAKFEVDKLGDLTADRIARELVKQLPNMSDLVLNALADLGSEGSALLARSEQQLRSYLSDRLKVAGKISTGNPEFDRALGNVSKEGKSLFEGIAQDPEKFGGTLVKLKDDPIATINGGVDSLVKGASDTLNELTGKKADEQADEQRKREEQQRQEIARQQKVDRRLTSLLSSINRISIIERTQPDYSKHAKSNTVSALNLSCFNATAAANGDSDAVVGLLFRANGFKSAAGGRDIDSDIRNATVRVKDLFAKGSHPKVQINVPDKIKHGSTYPAQQMLFDELAAAVEQAIPDADIQGYFRERKFAVRNLTGERVRIWFQVSTHGFNAQPAWAWVPAGPGSSGFSQEAVLAPNESRVLRIGSKEATGMRARFWAESETGQIWRNYMDEDLWLVAETDHLGRHRYLAPDISTFTYDLTPSDGVRRFTERELAVTNDTKATLNVRASVWTFTVGKTASWRDIPSLKLKPGGAAILKQADGWLVCGSQVRLSAQDADGKFFRWTTTASRPLTVVDAEGYRSARIGRCILRLQGPHALTVAAEKGDQERSAESFEIQLPVDQVCVPDVTNIALSTARIRLEDLSFQSHADVGARGQDQVVRQAPRSGWSKPNAIVELEAGVVVPNVVGKAVKFAARDLERVGLDPEFLRTADPESTVIAQRPGNGYAPRHTIVILALKAPEVVLVAVPPVEGLAPEVAKTELLKRGLLFRWDRDIGRKEFVYQQSPSVGTKINPKSENVIVLTPGINIPNVGGKSLSEAKSDFEARGIQYDISTREQQTEDPQLDGKLAIENQSVVGQQASDVRVGLSIVKYSLVMIEVPNLRGSDINQARTAVESCGLVFSSENNPEAGPVQDQRPAATTLVARGTTITGVFPVGVRLPDFTNHTYDEAAKWLQDAKIGFQTVNDTSQPIMRQDPPFGKLVRAGEIVTLYFPQAQPTGFPLQDFNGWTLADATVWLQQNGLGFRVANDTSRRIVSQQPAFGTTMHQGESVILYFPDAQPNLPPANSDPPPANNNPPVDNNNLPPENSNVPVENNNPPPVNTNPLPQNTNPPPTNTPPVYTPPANTNAPPRMLTTLSILGTWMGEGIILEFSPGVRPHTSSRAVIKELNPRNQWITIESGVVVDVTLQVVRLNTQFGIHDFSYAVTNDADHFDMLIRHKSMRFRRINN